MQDNQTIKSGDPYKYVAINSACAPAMAVPSDNSEQETTLGFGDYAIGIKRYTEQTSSGVISNDWCQLSIRGYSAWTETSRLTSVSESEYARVSKVANPVPLASVCFIRELYQQQELGEFSIPFVSQLPNYNSADGSFSIGDKQYELGKNYRTQLVIPSTETSVGQRKRILLSALKLPRGS